MLSAFIASGVTVAAAEAFVRKKRLVDYPLFVLHDSVGYHYRPNSEANICGLYRWRMNAKGLRLDHDRPASSETILLLGDSVVEGGNYLNVPDTLAGQIEAAMGSPVYPVACGGWALENELAFLRLHPDLLTADTLVFVVNSRDLIALNRSRSECEQPTRRPLLHCGYLLDRLTWPRRPGWLRRTRRSMPAPGPADAWIGSIEALIPKIADKSVVWVFYPDMADAQAGQRPCTPLRNLVAGRGKLVEVLDIPGWGADCYGDDIHPNRRGRELLAGAIIAALSNGTD